VVTDQVAGAPQGSPVSPLIADIVLHVLDEEWARSGQGLGVLVRYCDDFVVLTRSRAAAEAAKARIVSILERLGLRLHPDKTRIVCLAKGQEGFVFLGFEHRLRESKRWRGRWYLQSGRRLGRWPPSGPECGSGRLCLWRACRWRTWSVTSTPCCRGWGAYFAVGNSSAKFHTVDSYVHLRMAKLASKKHGLHGRHWATRFTYGWLTDLGIYRLGGKVRYHRAASA